MKRNNGWFYGLLCGVVVSLPLLGWLPFILMVFGYPGYAAMILVAIQFGDTAGVVVAFGVNMAIYSIVVHLACYYITRSMRWYEGLCIRCGYDLTGNESGTCSECGSPISSNK